MLDITERDIAELNDTDLRSLVAMLAEATLRSKRLPSSAVAWGGNQNAPDGGVDVRVSLSSGTTIEGFISRCETGYQVKKPAMSPAAITMEMRPGGRLRDSIGRLAEQGGAYIIACSGSDHSDSALRDRRSAMRSAVADHPSGDYLAVDFLDRQRLATWVRDHPALVPWVRSRVGRSIQGWHSFHDWGVAGGGISEEFIIDDSTRIFTGASGGKKSATAVSTLSGLQEMREVLSRPTASLRLIGLSGVGKTRLVKALFDSRVGADALNPSQSIYTDLSHHPEPSPIALATHLIALNSLSIIIVDNCPAQMHRQLTEICRKPDSRVNCITVEYDIRDDLPEGTDVFRLFAASSDVVANIVSAHCNWISQVDARSIGAFSGGNARVGLALAHATRFVGSLSGLSDEDLFVRLFNQRHPDDANLMASAEICALVYSFDGEATVGADAELTLLADLAGCPPAIFVRHIAELKRRGLLQMRSKWRAVLPHAIANRLAARALENIPFPRIQSELIDIAPERLFKSFTRRISYLHCSNAAIRIATNWLLPSGLLGAHFQNLNRLGMGILLNIAPVVPEAVLEALERQRGLDTKLGFFSADSPNRDEFVRLIRKIAFDASLFDRCANLLVEFAVESDCSTKRHNDEVVNVWTSLFSPFLSGTHASPAQRLRVIDVLIRSGSSKGKNLGFAALSAFLETIHFSSTYNFEFGAHSRDYGYHPSTREAQRAWYSAAIQLVIGIEMSISHCATDARALLAQKLPGLWVSTETQDLLVSAAENFSVNQFWDDGWIAVREAIWRSRNSHDTDALAKLRILEAKLAPATLMDNIQVHVARDRNWIFDTDDDPDAIAAAMSRSEACAEELGSVAASESALLQHFLPKLARQGSSNRWHFSRGLARGTASLTATWSMLFDAVDENGSAADPSILIGYMSKWKEMEPSGAYDAIDSAIRDSQHRQWVPQLESAGGLNATSCDRLLRALDAGAPAWCFRILSRGRLTDAMSPPELSNLLLRLSEVPQGWSVAVEVLAMRFHSVEQAAAGFEILFSLGRKLLCQIDISHRNYVGLDYSLSIVASKCLIGSGGEISVRRLCDLLAEAFGRHEIYIHDFKMLIDAIFETQPIEALDSFCRKPQDNISEYSTILGMFDEFSSYRASPLTKVSDESILAWCARDPDRNYIAAASIVTLAQSSSGRGGMIWNDLATRLMEDAPDPVSVLAAVTVRLLPRSWSGSRAVIIEGNAELLAYLERSSNIRLAAAAQQERQKLLKLARQERLREQEGSRQHDERFE